MGKLIEIYQERSHRVIKFSGIKFKYKHDDSKYFKFKKQEPDIKKYKYVHLMNNGIHTVSIINFINKYFDNTEHCFIFPCIMFNDTKEKLKDIKNIYYCPIENIAINKVNKIIIHGLFDINLVKQLYKNKALLKKTYWFIWGGDLYTAPSGKMDDYVRKNIAGILTSFDKKIYEQKYAVQKPCFDVTYPHDIKEEMISADLKEKGITHIQINNSTDNTTEEMLENLSKFKDCPIKVSVIMSYLTVGHKVNRLKLIKKGYDIFGTKFNPIIDFMPKEEYVNHLASVDIYISNQNRQQGNGNSTFIHSLGGKIFLKSDTSVYKKYNSIGMKIFDTYEIPNLSFEEFCTFDNAEKEKSVSILKERMKDETKVKQWGEFFSFE